MQWRSHAYFRTLQEQKKRGKEKVEGSKKVWKGVALRACLDTSNGLFMFPLVIKFMLHERVLKCSDLPCPGVLGEDLKGQSFSSRFF